MKARKLTEKLKEEKDQEGELPKKSIRKKEDKQLFWFVVVVVIVFMSFLVPYFYVQSSKSFEYAHINWRVEDYKNLRIYHGRFPSITNASVIFNTHLRTDPRKNNIKTTGNFIDFKSNAIISTSPEVDACRGELSRVMVDLGSFLTQGIGIGQLEAGSTNELIAENSNRKFATCENIKDRTVVVIEIGEPKVVQDEENKQCYTIYASNCQDITGAERFIVKTVDDVGLTLDEARKNLKEK